MELYNKIVLSTSAVEEISYEELIQIWSAFIPNTKLDHFEGLETVNRSFLITTKQVEDSTDLNFIRVGWKVNLNAGIIKTGLSMALLTGLLKASAVTGPLTGFVLPGVIALLFDVEKIKLTKKEEDIYAQLVVNKDIIGVNKTIDELYELLPTNYKENINPLDFKDFVERLELTGRGVENRNREFKLYGRAKLKITIE